MSAAKLVVLHTAMLYLFYCPLITLHVSHHRLSGGQSHAGDLATPIRVPGKRGYDSPDAFPLEYGGKLKTGFGIRSSRSYDLLSEAVKNDEHTDGHQLALSCSSTSLYGSPRYSHISV